MSRRKPPKRNSQQQRAKNSTAANAGRIGKAPTGRQQGQSQNRTGRAAEVPMNNYTPPERITQLSEKAQVNPYTVEGLKSLSGKVRRARANANKELKSVRSERHRLLAESRKLDREIKKLSKKSAGKKLVSHSAGTNKALPDTALAEQLDSLKQQRVANGHKRSGLTNKINNRERAISEADQVITAISSTTEELRTAKGTEKHVPKKFAKKKKQLPEPKPPSSQSDKHKDKDKDTDSDNTPPYTADNINTDQGTAVLYEEFSELGGHYDIASDRAITSISGDRYNAMSNKRRFNVMSNTGRMLKRIDDAGIQIDGESVSMFLAKGGNPNDRRVIDAINQVYNFPRPITSFIYNLSN